MKKQMIIFFSFLLFCSVLFAQNGPIIVVSTHGNVAYTSESKETMFIASGAIFNNKGMVILPKKGYALVLCNGSFKNLKIGKNSLSKICGGDVVKTSLNIDGKFADYVYSSVQLAYMANGHNEGWEKITDPNNLAGDGWGTGGKDAWGTGGKDAWGTGGKDAWGTGGKDAWGTGGKDAWGTGGKDAWGTGGKDAWGTGGRDAWGTGGKDAWGTGGRDAWGGNGKKILPILPIGKLEAKTTRFSWSQPADASSYRLEIKDQSNNVIHEVIVKDTFAEVNLKKLKLDPEAMYSWTASIVDNEAVISEPIQFATYSSEEKEKSFAKLSKSKIYAATDQTTRLLIEAVLLEEDQWYYDAAQLYKSLKKKEGKNNLVNMMHAALWMRAGLPEIADAVVMP